MNSKTSHDSETLKAGQQVITACAFIFHNFDGVKKVFLPKRASAKKFLPDVFELPGGHIDFGEEVADGLKREIFEEFKMNIKLGEPFFAFTYINKIKQSHAIEVIYFAEFTDPIEDIKINTEDHSTFKWISENEIENIISENKRANDQEVLAIKKGFEILNR